MDPRADDRGFLARTFCEEEFADHGLPMRIVQSSTIHTARRGTLRGLHYQEAPHREIKLVRVTRGAIFLVMVDLRAESPTYARWEGVELTADNRRMALVPEGFAQGYQTLEDDTEVHYQMSHEYVPESARGVRWDDPALRHRVAARRRAHHLGARLRLAGSRLEPGVHVGLNLRGRKGAIVDAQIVDAALVELLRVRISADAQAVPRAVMLALTASCSPAPR